MPKKPRNSQRSTPAGVKSKQNYPRNDGGANINQRANGQFHCTYHGPNTSHDTAGCRQSPSQTQNANRKNENTYQGQKRACTQCGKNGHLATDCWVNKPTYQQQQKKRYNSTPPPYSTDDPNKRDHKSDSQNNYYSAPVQNAAENYCGHCNVQGHNPATCDNVLGMYEAFRSRLYCLACSSKGHMADDCNNPLSTQCTSCFRKGHSSLDCKLNPDRDAQLRLTLAVRNTKQRYVWRHPGIEQHLSQKAEAEYEEAKKNAAFSGVPISAEDDYKYRRNIYLASHVFGQNPFVETAKNLGADVHSNTASGALNTLTRYAQPAVQNATNTLGAKVTTKNTTIAKQRNFLEQLRRGGHSYEDIRRFEEIFNTQNQQEKTELDKAIAAKIDASLCYRKDFVNNFIRRNEAVICTKALLPQSRMDEIKFHMSQGGSFFRDPTAIKALFERQVPRCTKCYKNGFIVDRWFNVIAPTLPKVELLKLNDMEDWGLFVAFKCSCSRPNNYEYLICSLEDYNSLPDDEK